MNFLNSHDIEKMFAEQDLTGLYSVLEQGDPAIRLEAAQALAELDDNMGWQFLFNTVRQEADTESQIAAADILGDLGDPRAIPALEAALTAATKEEDEADEEASSGEEASLREVAAGELNAPNEAAEALKAALESIGGREADEALRRAGYEPVLPHRVSGGQVMAYDPEYIASVLPDTSKVEFLTAEQHLNNAVSLREADLAERALVEDSLALWLRPEWEYGWYLRGVLYEDLERSFEAALCYRWAIELDPTQPEAKEALTELEAENIFPKIEGDTLLGGLSSMEWEMRRDAAAGLGEMGEAAPEGAVEALMKLLDDDEREVRHAAIEALGNIGNLAAVEMLAAQEEESWLLNFALIEALAQLKSVDGLVVVLNRIMIQFQERNPIFSKEKDPMLEVEYERLMEVGVLAFEKTGDIQALLALAEDNAWVEEDDDEDIVDVEELDEEAFTEAAASINADASTDADASGSEFADEVEDDEENDLAELDALDGEFDEDEDEYEDMEADEDLEDYVDEVALMGTMALERLAMPRLAELDADTLRRLANVPDLALLEIPDEDDVEEEIEPDLTVIHDLSALRQAAQNQLERK